MATVSRGNTSERYRFIERNRQAFGINYLCTWLHVSRSGYYDWRNREASARTIEDRQLAQKIVSIHRDSRGIYGSPRIHESLKTEGIAVGKKRVARLMQAQGLQGRVTTVVRRQPGLKRFVASGDAHFGHCGPRKSLKIGHKMGIFGCFVKTLAWVN